MKRPQYTTTIEDPRDTAFAERVVVYLERKGLDLEAVIRCLMDEFELDRETATELATLAA